MSYKTLLKLIKEDKERPKESKFDYYSYLEGIGPLKLILCKENTGRVDFGNHYIRILPLDAEDIEYFKNKACRELHIEKQKEMQQAIDKLSEIEKEYNNLNCK